MMEEMSVSSGAAATVAAVGFGNGAAGVSASARAGGGGGGFGLNNTYGSAGSGGPLSPPLSPMYSSPKGVSPRTNILPSFAWGKTMLKHLKRRPPGGASAPGAVRMTGHGAGSLRAGAGGGVEAGDGGGGSGAGVGGWGAGAMGCAGLDGEGMFVYPPGMVQV